MLSIALGFVSVMAFKGNNFYLILQVLYTNKSYLYVCKKESAIKSLSDVKGNTEIGIASEKRLKEYYISNC